VNDAELIEALRRADAAARPAYRTPEDLPASVAARVTRRRRRAAVTYAACALVAAVALTAIWRPDGSARRAPIEHAGRASSSWLRLEREADLRMRVALRTRSLERRAEPTTGPGRSVLSADALVDARLAGDQAALALLAEARRQEDELGLRTPAIASYRQIVAVFPRTAGAQAARERLALLELDVR